MSQTDAIAAARAFARNLNILLKYVRLYGAQHQRTLDQLELAWKELAMAADKESGLLLGVAEDKLLLDGVAVDGLAERSFVSILKTSGISSIHFAQNVSRPDFERCAAAFASGKPNELGKQLREAGSAIKVNELKFVAQDESQARATELVAQALGTKAGEMKEWLSDPEKLVQLIAAAEGSTKSGPDSALEKLLSSKAFAGSTGGGSGTGAGSGDASGAGNGTGSGGTGSYAYGMDEPGMQKVLRILARLGAVENAGGGPSVTTAQEVLKETPDALSLLKSALTSLPALANEADGKTIAHLAEKLAIRFARQQFERGAVKVDAVHELLERMGKEIDSLRKILNAHEDKMGRAGIAVESYADLLDRQFWASMPERGKQLVLLSKDAWCIPARNVRSYVQELMGRGDQELATRILRNYARQLANNDPEGRKKTAAGLSELADLYGSVATDLLTGTLQTIGLRLQCETVMEQQTLLGAAYVRLTQEASQRRDYAAMKQSLNILDRLQEWRPRTAQEVRPRITIENKLGEFIAEAVREQDIPSGLVELLRRVPIATAEQIALQFSACGRRSECDRFTHLVSELGPAIVDCLQAMLVSGSAAEAARSVGILSRTRPDAVDRELRRRIAGFARVQQDIIIRQLAAGGGPNRGALLMDVLNVLDPLVAPEALDEIGLCGEQVSPTLLLEMAAGEGLANGHEYLRVKAIEALGRLREASATEVLESLASAKGLSKLTRPRELRLVAAQALALIDPERVESLLDETGFAAQELRVGALPASHSDWVRQRRYPRIQPTKNLSMLAITPKGRYSVGVTRLSLGGGLLNPDRRLPRTGDAVLEWQSGFSRMRSHVVLRELTSREMAFEVVDIDLDGRGRLRKMLIDYLPSGGSNAAISPAFLTGSVNSADRTSAI